MRIPISHAAGALAALLAVFSGPASGASSYDSCAGYIDTVPATLTTQGTWCLSRDLASSLATGAAITAANNNITIDCNGFKLNGLTAGTATQAAGILSHNRLNVTVRGCSIRGFQWGIYLGGSEGGGHLVEDNRLDANRLASIFVAGDGSTIRRNLVLDTGGGTTEYESGEAFGIWTYYDVDVLDNTVSGVAPTGVHEAGNGEATGIYTVLSNGTIAGNRVRGLASKGAYSAFGIDYAGGVPGRYLVSGNHVVGDLRPGSIGIRCLTDTPRVRDNVVSGFPTGIQMCVGSGNDVVP